MNAKANDQFPFSIKNVRQIHLTINEGLYVHNEDAVVKLGMSQTTSIDIKKDLLDFTIFIFLHYEDAPLPHGIIADIKVQNLFHIPNIERLKGEEGTLIPDTILIPIVSMAISHTRALFCQALAGTVYDGMIIPITDPLLATRYMFPKKEQEKNKSNISKVAKKAVKK